MSGSTESVVIENGALYLQVVAPCLMLLALLNPSRLALQSIGNKILPVISSVIELVGKYLFVAFFIPRFQYMAVIFCEPVIWCVMTAQLLYTFYHDSYIRSFRKGQRRHEDMER